MKQSTQQRGPKVNNQIRAPEVRVIEDGVQLGVMSTVEAVRLAKDKGVDLIEINPQNSPPICKLMEYGKYKYEQKKKEHAQKAHQHQVDTKELRLRPSTEENDLVVKVNQAKGFIEKGDKVRFTMMFSGREMMYKDQGQNMFQDILTRLGDLVKLDSPIKSEGRSLIMTLSANQKVKS